jgi:hypothetical protein
MLSVKIFGALVILFFWVVMCGVSEARVHHRLVERQAVWSPWWFAPPPPHHRAAVVSAGEPRHGTRRHHSRVGGRHRGERVVHERFGDGRPRAWCGWYMRRILGGGPEFNLARHWATWGRAAAVGTGVVVVWAHHVGIDRGACAKGRLIESGNDGHAVRTRCRSIAGAIAFRERG